MVRTTRARIIAYLTERPDASASQIARRLGMSAPAVRHHLAILQSDGRIELAPASAPGTRRGRPEKRYRLGELLAGNNLAMVADALLSSRGSTPRSGPRKQFLSALKQGLVAQLSPIHPPANAGARITGLVERLNALNYRATWEAGEAGPRFAFGHCPYSAIIDRHPELCEMDAAALADLMQAGTRQVSKINKRTGIPARCIFAVRQ